MRSGICGHRSPSSFHRIRGNVIFCTFSIEETEKFVKSLTTDSALRPVHAGGNEWRDKREVKQAQTGHISKRAAEMEMRKIHRISYYFPRILWYNIATIPPEKEN